MDALARKAARLFQMIQSVDSLRLANFLDGVGNEYVKKIPVLLEVNMSREASKTGFDPTGLEESLSQLAALPHLDIRGLMTIGPMSGGPEAARAAFRELRLLRDRLVQDHPSVPLPTLSMGMTDDFEIAIEEGSTMVRVGRAIFGHRT